MIHVKIILIINFALEVLNQEEYSCVSQPMPENKTYPAGWEVVMMFAVLDGGQQAKAETVMRPVKW